MTLYFWHLAPSVTEFRPFFRRDPEWSSHDSMLFLTGSTQYEEAV